LQRQIQDTQQESFVSAIKGEQAARTTQARNAIADDLAVG
jgi:hypothetical protein